jgi:hypothetical protein
MMKHQPVKPLESWHRIVTKICGLIPLFAHDPHSYRGSLDHINVIASITNGQRELVFAALHESDDVCLVFGG